MRAAGLMITLIGVMMADSDKLIVPVVVTAIGILLMKIGGMKDVER